MGPDKQHGGRILHLATLGATAKKITSHLGVCGGGEQDAPVAMLDVTLMPMVCDQSLGLKRKASKLFGRPMPRGRSFFGDWLTIVCRRPANYYGAMF